MKIVGHKCDLCPAVKGEGNHWFHVVMTAETITISTWKRALRGNAAQRLDLCGDACVQRAVQTFLERKAVACQPMTS